MNRIFLFFWPSHTIIIQLRLFLSLLFCLAFCWAVSAQQLTFIQFTEKDSSLLAKADWVSLETLQNRKIQQLPMKQYSDLPLKSDFSDSLENHGIKILSKSKWLNGITAFCNQTQLEKIKNWPFIKATFPIKGSLLPLKKFNAYDSLEMAMVLEQVGGKFFKEANLNGKGISIGMIDAGFNSADKNPALARLVKNGKVKKTKDWQNPESANFFANPPASDDHGMHVWNLIAGLDSTQQKQYGLAFESDFYLARTDHDTKEFRSEMGYWVEALEWLDSCGVRLVNSSLGYGIGFDDKNEDFSPEEIDGKTSIVAKASDIAFTEKGMLVVVSAGNDGNVSKWKIISTPADAKHNLTVGSTYFNVANRMNYSGIGPKDLEYVKPEVACFSFSGTSFSAPVVTGFAACLWQKNPKLRNSDVKEIILKSAHLAPFANNFIGFGVPSAEKAIQLLDSLPVSKILSEKPIEARGKYVFQCPDEFVTEVGVFHKRNEREVEYQSTLNLKKGKVTLFRPYGIEKSTIHWPGNHLEIEWK